MTTTLVFLTLLALALWALLATVLRLATDGYGRPEIASRNRRAERMPEAAPRIR